MTMRSFPERPGSQLNQPAQATSDASGNATFTFPGPPAGMVNRGTINFAGAPLPAQFSAYYGSPNPDGSPPGQPVLTWFGVATGGPLQTNTPITVVGTGLTPSTIYAGSLLGSTIPSDAPGDAPSPVSPSSVTAGPQPASVLASGIVHTSGTGPTIAIPSWCESLQIIFVYGSSVTFPTVLVIPTTGGSPEYGDKWLVSWEHLRIPDAWRRDYLVPVTPTLTPTVQLAISWSGSLPLGVQYWIIGRSTIDTPDRWRGYTTVMQAHGFYKATANLVAPDPGTAYALRQVTTYGGTGEYKITGATSGFSYFQVVVATTGLGTFPLNAIAAEGLTFAKPNAPNTLNLAYDVLPYTIL